MVRYYLYGQQMPDDEFEIKHADFADYDKPIDGKNPCGGGGGR
jgi:hypothetical protein